MRTLTRREWKSWLRISVLVFIVHTIVTGLLNDWETFIIYKRDFYSLSSIMEVSQQTKTVPDISIKFWYPGILDSLTIPLFLIPIFYMSRRVIIKTYAIIFFVSFFALGIYMGNNDLLSSFINFIVPIFSYGLWFCIFLFFWIFFNFMLHLLPNRSVSSKEHLEFEKNEDEDGENKENGIYDFLFAIPGLGIGVGLVEGIANGWATSIEFSVIFFILFVFSLLTRQIFSKKIWSSLVNWVLAK